ncbi:unnamed protein product [Mytilus coruscus]|uniref:Endonuclease/exonuclease/phosphatase domain-containing protein n=1 Tax=Mytilus coruscus TaxID=42192 RepID=A0A6J8CSX2_MYTCO|nr:unnamed protein product [Mytilus coruscus]
MHLPNAGTIFFFCVYLPAASFSVELFKEYVDLLHELYSVYSQIGIVIFAGDFNAKVQGSRVSGVQDDRSKLLRRVLDEFSLISLNTQTFCKGPIHTFKGYENGPCSTIDHIIVPDKLSFKPENVNILDDHGLNLSDHFPIICTFNLGDSHPNLSTSSTNIAWNKALSNGSLTDYAFAVSQNLWTVDTNQTDIEKYYSEIVNSLVLAARDTQTIVKHKRHLKPYWNDHLTELHDSMIQRRNVWISEHRPRGEEYESNELRRVYDEYVAEMSSDIEKSIDVDQRLAWCIINSRRSRNTSDILLKLNNKLVNDPESVCAEFANLFEAIAKTSDHTEDKVNNKLLNLIRNRYDNDPIRPVFFYEISKIVTNLPNGKASGLDGISYEHLKYGGKLLFRHLCNLYNLIFDQCITPVDWKTSVVIPLFKGKGAVMLDLNVGCPVQADDIALISPTFSGMQCMINICYSYSVKWKFEFSPSKSQVLLFPKRNEMYRD